MSNQGMYKSATVTFLPGHGYELQSFISPLMLAIKSGDEVVNHKFRPMLKEPLEHKESHESSGSPVLQPARGLFSFSNSFSAAPAAAAWSTTTRLAVLAALC